MVKQYTETTEIIEEMKKSDLYFLLAENNWFIDFITQSGKYWGKRYRLFGGEDNKEHITVEFLPLLYKNSPDLMPPSTIGQELINYRMNAVCTLFQRWADAGLNKHHAKNPFGSKAFNEYLYDIGYSSADYLILMVPNNIS